VMYRGTFASCSNMAALTGIQFISTGAIQRLVAGDAGSKMTWGQEVTCAFLGGAASGPACCALELTMVQQQRFGGTFPGTIARIVRERGSVGLMRGLWCSTGREAIFTAGYLGSVPATQKLVKEHTSLNPWLGNFLGAIGGGLVCAAISQPLDTIKTCMQGDLERKKYGGVVDTFKNLLIEHGSIRAMYRGYSFRAANIIVDFLLLDGLSRFFAPLMYPERFKSQQ